MGLCEKLASLLYEPMPHKIKEKSLEPPRSAGYNVLPLLCILHLWKTCGNCAKLLV
jgi:hypothetical protein